MVGRRNLPNPSLNHIFNALLTGVQYTLSFQSTNFGLKWLTKLKISKHSTISENIALIFILDDCDENFIEKTEMCRKYVLLDSLLL